MEKSTLILGGARSGKTRRALRLAQHFEKRIYIATAQARDDEMAERITKHQAERGAAWTTCEAPLDLATPISAIEDDGIVAVIDCLTLWLSNLMLAERNIEHETAQLVKAIATAKCPLIFVSNEVGLGIVPETKLARTFRDAQGRLNQEIASVADSVEFVAAGLPLRLKP